MMNFLLHGELGRRSGRNSQGWPENGQRAAPVPPLHATRPSLSPHPQGERQISGPPPCCRCTPGRPPLAPPSPHTLRAKGRSAGHPRAAAARRAGRHSPLPLPTPPGRKADQRAATLPTGRARRPSISIPQWPTEHV